MVAAVAGILGIPRWDLRAQPLWRSLDGLNRPWNSPVAVRHIADTLATQLATITTDTGPFAPGRRDFARYDTPELCLIAARSLASLSMRTVQAKLTNLMQYDTDTTGTGATAAIVRRCGARFTLAGTTVGELPDLYELALYEQNDTLARAVLAKEVAQAATAKNRDSVLAWAARLELSFKNKPAVNELWSQIEHSKDTAPLRERLAEQDRWLYVAAGLGDTVGVRRAIGRIAVLADSVDLPLGYNYVQGPDSDSFLVHAFRVQMALNASTFPDSLPTIARQAQRVLSRWSRQAMCPPKVPSSQCRPPRDNWDAVTPEHMLDSLAPIWVWWRTVHEQSPRLQAAYWFPAPGRPASDTVRPVRGKINLICSGAFAQGENFKKNFAFEHDLGFDLAGNNETNFIQVRVLRHWLALYGAAGLEVTIVRQVEGYPGGGGSPPTGDWAVDPATAARQWQWYEQVYDSLPVTVAVQVRHHDAWLPPPDGRWTRADTIQFARGFANPESPANTTPSTLLHLFGWNSNPDSPESNNQCVVIGRDGTILDRKSPGSGGSLDDLFRAVFTRLGDTTH